MKQWWPLLFVVLWFCGCGKQSSSAPEGTIILKCWRHFYETEDAAFKAIIEQFEAENPDIRIEYQSMPYKGFREKLDTSIHAGRGPDLVNIHNSWVYPFVKSDLLKPIPADQLPAADMETAFVPLMQSFKQNDAWYGIPIGGGCLALFINTDHLTAAGYPESAIPAAWEELSELALAMTQKKDARIIRTGFACGGIKSQSWNYLVEGLFRQNGSSIINDDEAAVTWDKPEGIEAFTWYLSFIREHGIYNLNFGKPSDTFIDETASMIVDLNIVIAKIKERNPDLQYKVVPLPGRKVRATYGSAWGMCVTKTCPPEKEAAAFTFLKFLAQESTAALWTAGTGELPLQTSLLISTEFMAQYPELRPFIDSMHVAYSSLKKDETAYKQAIVKAIETVILKNAEPGEALKQAGAEVNAMLQER